MVVPAAEMNITNVSDNSVLSDCRGAVQDQILVSPSIILLQKSQEMDDILCASNPFYISDSKER